MVAIHVAGLVGQFKGAMAKPSALGVSNRSPWTRDSRRSKALGSSVGVHQ